MRVVLLSYYFPPDQAVGALRPAKVCAALRAAGHRVTVVAARIPGMNDSLPGVIRVRPLPNPREAWLALKSLFQGNGPDRVTGSADPSTAGGLVAVPRVTKGKRWMNSLLWMPDDRQGFVVPAVAAALSRIQDGADLIYTTAPPFSTHLAGLVLKRLTGVRWAAEFRDPWTDNPGKPAHVRSRWSDAAERVLEDRCVRSADHLISVSAGIARAIESKVRRATPRGAGKALLVRNGIDTLAPPAPPAPPGPIEVLRIVHVGTFYQRRDPRPFLEALAKARPRLTARSTRLEVHFVGDCRWYDGISVEDIVKGHGLDDVVAFVDWVPHEQALALVRTAGLLLLLAQGQPAQVPNKLYEYLGTRRPILAFVDEEGESATILRQVGGHVLVTGESSDQTADAIERAARAPAAAGDEAVLAELTSARQMARLVAALEQDGSHGMG